MKNIVKVFVTINVLLGHVACAAAADSSAMTQDSNSASSMTAEEITALLAKCALPRKDPYNQLRNTPTSVATLTDKEKSGLISLANSGNVSAQQYLWLAYFKGLYGFSQNRTMAGVLKMKYKAYSHLRRLNK